jgi:type III restriction enzyme
MRGAGLSNTPTLGSLSTSRPNQQAPPQPPETIQVKAVPRNRPLPRVQGYRVELPEERLTAEFNGDSVLELTPDLIP